MSVPNYTGGQWAGAGEGDNQAKEWGSCMAVIKPFPLGGMWLLPEQNAGIKEM